MTKVTPTRETIHLTATLTAPLHHGAGSAGNTALLRTREIVQPDGSSAAVPFVSANSIRHGLRDALAWHLAHTIGIPDGSLKKGVVDLLWTGGAVTTTGARTNLDLLRRADDLYPVLGLLGFAAQSDIYGGTLRVDDFDLVCSENLHRMPVSLRDSAHAQRRSGAYRDSEFGTRHDTAGGPTDRLVDLAAEITGTSQMIYDLQTLKPGSVLYGAVSLDPAATDAHRLALRAALALWAPGGVAMLAAKTAVGYGRATIAGIPDDADQSLETWAEQLRAHKDEIAAFLTEVVGV